MLTQLLLLLSVGVLCHCGPAEDLIQILPGLRHQPQFKQYSGYLQGSTTARLHYWFVQSQQSPSSDPLILWMNGGPGCSSMEGQLKENGPFSVTPDKYLIPNNYSWNLAANVLYLEAPAGVGYSYSTTGNVTTDDDLTSLNNYNALLDFFAKFPEFASNAFYITGESYAGVYIPTLAVRVLANPKINLKGIAVGNGLSSYVLNDNSLLYFANYHGLFAPDMWRSMQLYCCRGKDPLFCMMTKSTSDPNCYQLLLQATAIINYGLDIYNLYAPCAGGVNRQLSGSIAGRPYVVREKPKVAIANDDTLRYNGARSDPVIRHHDFGNLFRSLPLLQEQRRMNNLRRQYNRIHLSPPCDDSSDLEGYLNLPAVRYALHIPDNVPSFEVCSDAVNRQYNRTYNTMVPQYRAIIDKKIRILIYNGDVDMACNYLGDEWFFDLLNMTVATPRHHWLYRSEDGTRQIGGFAKSWLSGQVTFTTVKGSGHMVPEDKPAQAATMINSFLLGRPL